MYNTIITKNTAGKSSLDVVAGNSPEYNEMTNVMSSQTAVDKLLGARWKIFCIMTRGKRMQENISPPQRMRNAGSGA